MRVDDLEWIAAASPNVWERSARWEHGPFTISPTRLRSLLNDDVLQQVVVEDTTVGPIALLQVCGPSVDGVVHLELIVSPHAPPLLCPMISEYWLATIQVSPARKAVVRVLDNNRRLLQIIAEAGFRYAGRLPRRAADGGIGDSLCYLELLRDGCTEI